jgi:tetratricopeptide (TPR) repeat protein
MLGPTLLGFYYLAEALAYAKLRGIGWVRVPVLVALSLYLVFLAVITTERIIIWGKPIELFEETIRYEPYAYNAYNSVGMYYYREGEYQKAETFFREAIRRGTRSPLPYYNMGLLSEMNDANDPEVATWYYHKALELDPSYKLAERRLRERGAL